MTKWATRRAKATIATSTPTITPRARLCVHTVTATVESITRVSGRGIRARVEGRTECQSNVAHDTKIMMATRAAIGMTATTSPRVTTRSSRKIPARKVEMRVRAPEARTLIIVWPIIAHPPIPPKKPVTMLAAPCAQDSRVLFERVSVMSSTSLAVISDSSRPTSAMVRANGAMIRKVSRSSGTSGKNSDGRDSGSSPLSPTLGTSMPIGTTIAVITTMATSGAGTAPVSRGNRNTMARPRAVSG